MTEQAVRIARAVQLMEQALALLDECPGEELPACRLQAALDALLREPVMKEGDEIDPLLLSRFGFDLPCPTPAMTG